MYSGLARQTSSGSLHFAVAMSSGFCRHSSTVNPFCDGGILKPVLSGFLWLSGKLSPWRCNRVHCLGAGPRPRPPGPLSAPREAGTGAGPGLGRPGVHTPGKGAQARRKIMMRDTYDEGGTYT